MNKKALVVIDMQNDITRHYRDIIENINSAVDWAVKQGMAIIYIKHNNLEAGNGGHLYQTQQFVRRNPYLQTGYKRSGTCAGAQACLGSYFR